MRRTNTNNSSYRTTASSLWRVLFRIEGNIFIAVLPFCIVNCLLLALVEYLEQKDDFGFSPTGHGLLTLLVSFLVISKVNLAYERFRLSRHYTGNAFLHMRELNQLVVTVSTSYIQDDFNDDNEYRTEGVHRWRSECVHMIVEIIDATKRVIQDDKLAGYLARNENRETFAHYSSSNIADPLVLTQALRLHLYGSRNLQLLERVNLMSKLNEYVTDYRALLDLASTPMPFALVQMGRAFLFLWTFTMPLVLRQGPFSDLWTAMGFLFFLTYGFIGLELVSMKLCSPFGDGVHDIQVTALRDATIVGIEQDLQSMNLHQSTVSQRRLQFQQQKEGDDPKNNPTRGRADANNSDSRFDPNDKYISGNEDPNGQYDMSAYHAMAGSEDMIP
mmetsp:Transcript_2914/g.4718  ORF Transcript_2914/g.4718 Transcript_2914/m.4718 type:complete len:388 (-) Transcript_2914:63-1226(-)|eukprot:CAMPEP_0119014208 /NCGR_PEP_ID=MMETSP1176-20130426/9414_1 /TAXON_ID=265551 /ORGANISM="Synedropsis recta cf, Strain CCMP1620" /LENGTH=387 /DNA_ID=CAMNT_0006967359 /DNA_START=128 /DNA_END=1291 /DNA_ORIENTATION=-